LIQVLTFDMLPPIIHSFVHLQDNNLLYVAHFMKKMLANQKSPYQ